MLSATIKNLLAPSQISPDQLDIRYRLKVAEQLKDAVGHGNCSASDIFSKMRGVFPSDVVEYSPGLKTQSDVASNPSVIEYGPELHALHYEWYFTPSVAQELNREFAGNQTLTVCLGVPTVASAAVSQHKAVIFIDRNAQTLIRFPELMRASEIHIMDAARARGVVSSADVLIFDPPWYPADTLSWLEEASHIVRPGGTVAFALYPSLTRPTAVLERELILEIASMIGTVDVVQDALAYDTPLFEREALKACGIYAGDWRRGDLVTIRGVKPVASPVSCGPCRADIDGLWRTFLIGSQVVKLRNHSSWADVLLSTIGDSFVFGAVTARNATRDRIHVWTSRNRVAEVGSTDALSDILQQIASGAPLDLAVRGYEGKFRTDIRGQLNEFLGLES